MDLKVTGCVEMWAEFFWLRTEFTGRSYEHENKSSGFIKD
jgi:hypothetical protein